jgi:hypothetical protein
MLRASRGAFQVGIALRTVCRRRQHEGQQFDNVAVSGVELGQLPIKHYGCRTEPDVALLEVVMRKIDPARFLAVG